MHDSIPHREFRYLDSEQDRKNLVADVRRVRRQVITLAEALPQDRSYEPRYHGWSLAALLMHLHLMDKLAMWSIKMALLNIHPAVRLRVVNHFNNRTARFFQRRLVTTTLREIRANEESITSFIMELPVDRFSKPVFYPPMNTELTVERAVQAYYLFHWQEHLNTLQKTEGIFYEPPNNAEA